MEQSTNKKTSWQQKITENLKKHFENPNQTEYSFTLSDINKNENNSLNTTFDLEQNEELAKISEVKNIYPSLEVTLEYIKVKYNTLINSDIVLREFTLSARNRQYKALLFFIDGMVDSQLINDNVLQALMLRNRANIFDGDENQIITEGVAGNITVRRVKKFDLENYVMDNLLPQNNVKKVSTFEEAFSGVNMGNCLLFIDTLPIAFDIDVKGYKQREISTSNNEIIIQGPQEAFVENLRTNTSLLRRVINNENLVIENLSVGKLSKTKCAVCYMKNIANSELVAEVKYRINNLEIDSLLSSGELEQLISEGQRTSAPQIINT